MSVVIKLPLKPGFQSSIFMSVKSYRTTVKKYHSYTNKATELKKQKWYLEMLRSDDGHLLFCSFACSSSPRLGLSCHQLQTKRTFHSDGKRFLGPSCHVQPSTNNQLQQVRIRDHRSHKCKQKLHHDASDAAGHLADGRSMVSTGLQPLLCNYFMQMLSKNTGSALSTASIFWYFITALGILYYFLSYWRYSAAFCLLFYIILTNDWMRVSTITS